MDPLSMMFLASNLSQAGQEQPMLNPAGSMPMGGAPVSPGPQAAAAAAPGGMGQAMGGLGKMMSGIQAPGGTDPKFSGGVSGSGLPYVSRIEDMISPFLQATGAGKPQSMPTLGMLLSQAPGGGR